MITTVLLQPASASTPAVPASTSPLPSNQNQFYHVDNFKAITFLFLMAVSLLFSIALFAINLYKTLKVTTEQKQLFYQASISMRRDNVEKDQFIQIGKKITTAGPATYNSITSSTLSSINMTHSSSSSSKTTAKSNSRQQQSKKDR